MKKAFTLAEIMITISIISVLAVLLAGNLQNSRPDENKIKYLKAYDALCETVSYLVNDTSFFSPTYNIEYEGKNYNFNFNQIPLMNTQLPTNGSYRDQNYSGKTKICNLLKENFDAEEINACNDNLGENLFNFKTTNDIYWRIIPNLPSTYINLLPNYSNWYYYIITIDINGGELPNSLTDDNPDRFEFFVAMDGNVIAKDRVGQDYIRKRNNYKKVPIDLTGLNTVQSTDDRLDIKDKYTKQIKDIQ